MNTQKKMYLPVQMSQLEIDCILKYIKQKPDGTMIEWGSGGSTLYYSQFVKRYYSIEHNSEWFLKVFDIIHHENLTNIDFCFTRPNIYHEGFEGRDTPYKEYEDYIEAISNYDLKNIDFALIDGRARIHCAERLADIINHDTIVFFHDFYRPLRTHYKKILDIYKIIESIPGEQSLAVLQLR